MAAYYATRICGRFVNTVLNLLSSTFAYAENDPITLTTRYQMNFRKKNKP